MNASVSRVLGPQSPFFVWARDRFPDGTYTAPTLGPLTINPPIGVSISRLRVQNVPATWPAGIHWYIAYANPTFSYPTVDADSFPWTKSTDFDLGPVVLDASCYGEPFPGEQSLMASVPSGLRLGVSPNPFNPTTTITFALKDRSFARLSVYDVLGREVATLVNGELSAGNHSVVFKTEGLASGVYLYRLTATSSSGWPTRSS